MDDVSVWRVNGHWVRDHVDVDFTNGTHDLISTYVPTGEIWLDREAPDAGEEWRMWLRYQLAHRQRMAAGATYLEALASAERIERRARRAALGGKVDRRVDSVRKAAVRRQLAVVDDRRVLLVRGHVVRDRAYVHFTMGGHRRRYRFIPHDEVWIDDAVAPAERAAVIHHELVELRLMDEEAMSYHEAHERASASEKDFRRRASAAAARR